MKEGDRSGFPKAAPTSWKMSVEDTCEQRMDCAKLVEQSALGVIEPPQHSALTSISSCMVRWSASMRRCCSARYSRVRLHIIERRITHSQLIVN